MAFNLEYSTAHIKPCIKATEGLFERVYHNICLGTSHVVQNGFYDHAGNILIATLVVSCLVVSFAFAYKLLTEI